LTFHAVIRRFALTAGPLIALNGFVFFAPFALSAPLNGITVAIAIGNAIFCSGCRQKRLTPACLFVHHVGI
jgi:hypothetical protein